MANSLRKQTLALVLVAGLGGLVWPSHAVSEDKGIIALQQSVSLLMNQVADLQKAFTTQTEVVKSLVSQNTDTVNQLSAVLKSIQSAISGNQVIASQQQNDISKQFQSLADTIATLQAHLQTMDDTLKQVQQMQQTIPAPAAPAAAPATVPAGSQPGTSDGATPATMANGAMADATAPGAATTTPAPAAASPLQLYQNALSDFQNNSPQAQTELSTFIRSYPNDPQVPDATFYLGTIYLQKQEYNEAIDCFSQVLEQYPDNPKAPTAELNKGIALAKRGDKTEAISELRALAKNYPGTTAARQADIELKGMGAGRTKPE